MIIHKCVQGSEKWHELRLGIPTASEFHRIVTPKTRRLSSQCEPYMHRLIAEQIYGAPVTDDISNLPWVGYGKSLELEAVRSYEFEREVETQQVGFITTDDRLIGASPDRLVGDEGLLETKCPSPPVHVGYMLTQAVSDDYLTQLHGQLWVCERQWVDIQSYCPRFPSVIIRVNRSEITEEIGKAVQSFVEVMQRAMELLEKTYGSLDIPPKKQELPEMTEEEFAAAMRSVV
jgi:hypothetical protein